MTEVKESKEIEVKKKEKTEVEEKEGKKSRELSLRRESPFSLFQQMDRLFDDLNRNFFDDWFWPFRTRRRRPLSLVITENEPLFRTPLSNITEDENNYNITAEIPGLDKQDIEITIKDNTLEIKGEVKEEKKEEKEGELIRRECYASSYYRAFSLPENIDADNIEANLEKGILTVKIPKVEPPEPEKKKIEVK
ncbi:MAG: Hsp20/alpha crystallin family protein [Candidatus Odinarchaeota archaeon]